MVQGSEGSRRWTLREVGDLFLALLPFLAIALLAGYGLLKARCAG